MKKEIKPCSLLHPSTIVLVGTIVNDKPNYTTIGDVAVAGLNPALIMISINENHSAAAYVNREKKMSINIPTIELLKEVDFAGVHSAKEVDKSNLFTSTLKDGLPVIDQSPITLLVRVLDKLQVKQRIIYVCEVYKTLIDTDIICEGKIQISEVKSILYGLDNKYYTIGDKVGIGYQEYKKFHHQS